MKSRFILELDHLASIEANMEFLRKCEKQIQQKKEDLKKLKSPPPKNQVDLEQLIEESMKNKPTKPNI